MGMKAGDQHAVIYVSRIGNVIFWPETARGIRNQLGSNDARARLQRFIATLRSFGTLVRSVVEARRL